MGERDEPQLDGLAPVTVTGAPLAESALVHAARRDPGLPGGAGRAAEPADPDTARGLIGVTVAGWLGNILSYLLLLAAARGLHADDYGELVTLLNLLLIGSVPSFALQAVGARRVATGQPDGLAEVGAMVGLGAALVLAVLSPLLVAFLHLPGPAGPLLVAAATLGTALQGLCQGIWQGRQRFSGLAATTFAGTAGRSAAGLLGLLVGGTAIWAMVALAVGTTLAAAGSALTLPQLRTRPRADRRVLKPLLLECGSAAHAYGVFLLLSVADVLLARHVLPAAAAAGYAAGSVVTKGCLWLPQSVANVLFASLTDSGRHHRVFARAVASIAGLGALLTAGCWLLGPLVTRIVGGSGYASLRSEMWIFALLGSSLAVIQFTLVAGLAVRSVAVTAVVWLSVLAEVVAVLGVAGHPSVRLVAELVCAINVVAAAAATLGRLRLRSAA